MDDILTVAQVAKLLRLSEITVYKFAKTGELPFIRIGCSFRMKKEAYLKLIKRQDKVA